MTRAIRVLALDVDGVLTDGTVAYDADRGESKALSYQDLDAIREAQRRGLRVALITAESGPWTDFVRQRTNADLIIANAKDKERALRELAQVMWVELNDICYVGDGDRDAPALRLAGRALAPANATPLAKQAANQVLSRRGGDGAVHEAVTILLAADPTETVAASASPGPAEIVLATMDEHLQVCKLALESMNDDIARAGELIASALARGKKLLIFGNGGSAADAQHFAAELVGRFERERGALPALALTADTSIVTALGNDYGFETVFARQIEAFGREGDVAVAISTSGNSPNVVSAVETARRQGMSLISMTGESGGRLRPISEICLRVPSDRTARIQEVHAIVIHALCEIVDSVRTNSERQPKD